MRSKDSRWVHQEKDVVRLHLLTSIVSSDCQIYDDVPQEAAYLESDLGKPEIPKGVFER